MAPMNSTTSPRPAASSQQLVGELEVLQRACRPALQQLPEGGQPLDGLLVPGVEGERKGLQSFAEGAEADHQQARPGLAPDPSQGGEQGVDAFGVDELADVDDERRSGVQRGREPVAGVLVVRPRVVGGRNLPHRADEFVRSLLNLQGVLQGRLLLRATPLSPE